MVPRRIVLASLVCLLLAGCVGGPTGSVGSEPTEPADQPAYGTQLVSVVEYDGRNASGTAFGNLTEAQRRVFLRVVEGGQVRFGPDETTPFDYHDDDRPEFVKYEGNWYFVRVAIA